MGNMGCSAIYVPCRLLLLILHGSFNWTNTWCVCVWGDGGASLGMGDDYIGLNVMRLLSIFSDIAVAHRTTLPYAMVVAMKCDSFDDKCARWMSDSHTLLEFIVSSDQIIKWLIFEIGRRSRENAFSAINDRVEYLLFFVSQGSAAVWVQYVCIFRHLKWPCGAESTQRSLPNMSKTNMANMRVHSFSGNALKPFIVMNERNEE